MPDEDRKKKRERFLRELATRDLYEWFGIARDAGDDAVRAAAERKRTALSSTPMPQHTRSIERAFCDQGEKVLLRPDVRREYDALLQGAPVPRTGARSSAARVLAEREERLRVARERVQHYGDDDARMVSGPALYLADPTVVAALAAERESAAGVSDAAAALATARRARASGNAPRALAHAERAHALAASPASLNTLGGARRDVGDLPGSEAALRESVAALPGIRENAPGWAALAATLRARGKQAEAADIGVRLLEYDDDDARAWRLVAMVATDDGDSHRAGDAWERSARLGLDVPGALAGLQVLRKDCLARNDRLAAAEVEERMARIRGT